MTCAPAFQWNNGGRISNRGYSNFLFKNNKKQWHSLLASPEVLSAEAGQNAADPMKDLGVGAVYTTSGYRNMQAFTKEQLDKSIGRNIQRTFLLPYISL